MDRGLQVKVVVLAVLVGVVGAQLADRLVRADAYSYFDTLVDVRSELMRNFVNEPDEQQMLEGSIRGMIDALDDPFTEFLSREDLEQFDRQTRGSFSGIGAEISTQDGQLMIVSPLEDSPAFNAGITAGDRILEIDGESSDGLTTQEAVQRITGPEGTDVTLTVRHADGEERDITITRARIDVETVRGFERTGENHWRYMLDEEAGVAYVRVSQFAEPTVGALREAVDEAKAQGMKGLILDLRFNPGGLLDQAIDMTDLFLDEGDIVSVRGRSAADRTWSADPNGNTNFPMIVLVNEFSASGSEIVAGALRDNERAVVLGTRSFGKGSVQQVLMLESGAGALKITTALYYLPSGRNLDRVGNGDEWGVDPNDGFYVPMSPEQIRAMHEIRRDRDAVRRDNGDRQNDRITPEYLSEERSDPQLAAAMEAMLARLETGEFKEVGGSATTLAAHQAERDEIEERRELLQESLAELEEELRELEQDIAEEEGELEAAE